MKIDEYSGEVGINKIFKQFIDANNLHIPQSLLLVFRFSGFVVLAFLLYLLILGLLDWRAPITWVVWVGYLVYEIILNILRKLNAVFYDSELFMTVRIVINVVFITGFIMVAPQARLILAFLYLIPIILTIILSPESNWAYGLVIAGVGLGFYIGGVSSLVSQPLPWPQALVTFGTIVALGYFVKAVYPKGSETPPGLFAIAQTLYQIQDLNKLVTEINKICIRLTSADYVLTIVVDPDSRRYLDHDMQGFELREGVSIVDITQACSVLNSGKPFSCEDLIKEYGDKTFYHQMFSSPPGAIIAQPILNQQKAVLGVINVAYQNPKKLDVYLLRVMQQFTALASRAIEISLNFRSINLENARNRKAAEALMNAISETDVMTVLAEKSLQLSSSIEAVNVHKLNSATKELNLVSSFQCGDPAPRVYTMLDEEAYPVRKMKVGEGIAGNALAYRESILVDNVKKHPWFWGEPLNSRIASLLVAPMFDPTNDEPIGTISVHSREIAAFSNPDEFNLVSLAHQGANAISKFRAVTRWEMHDSMLMRILNATRTFDIKLPIEKFCQRITDAAIQVLDFDIARIRLWYPTENEYITVARSTADEYDNPSQTGYRIPGEVIEKFLDEKFKIGRSYLVRHETVEMHELIYRYFSLTDKPFNQHDGWQKYDGLITPLRSPEDGQIIGILTLDHPKHGAQPTREIIEAIGSFAGIAEWAIELSKTHRELAESHETTMSFIKSISDFLSQTIDSDIDLIGWMVVQIGAELLNAEGCSLHLIDGNNLRLAYSTHLASTMYIGREKPISSKPGAGLSAWVAATGKPILIKSGEHDKHTAWGGETEHLRFIKSGKSFSVLLVPVHDRGGHIVGVITLENKLRFGKVVDFGDNDLEKLNILSSQIGLALEIAGHYKTIRQWEREGLQDDLHELIGLYQSSVVLQLDVMRDWLGQADLEKIENILPRIIKRARTTLEELKTVHTAVYSKYLELEFVRDSLATIIETWSKRCGSSYEKPLHIAVECPPDLSLPVEIRGSCMRIAACAISNAILHSGVLQDDQIRIDICVEEQGDKTLLKVMDTGIGSKPLEEGFGMKRMRDLVVKINEEPHFRANLKVEQTGPKHGITVSLEVIKQEQSRP